MVAAVVAAVDDVDGLGVPGSRSLIQRSTLPSGVRVVTETMPGSRSVAVGAYVAVGGRDEADEVAGASHFLEHLLFKGTEGRSARELAEAIDATGGEMNAYTCLLYTSDAADE